MKALFSMLLLVACAPVFAEEAAAPSPVDAAAPAAVTAKPAVAAQVEDEKIVCRLEKTLGSNKSKRVCRTVRERDEAREGARQQMDRAQRGL